MGRPVARTESGGSCWGNRNRGERIRVRSYHACMKKSGFFWCLGLGAVVFVAASAGLAQGVASPMPKMVEKDGRWALMVDGAPYLMLGVQVNNSSAWPGMLPEVWPAAEKLHANTVEMPVYWEQLEAVKGKYDFSVMDSLLAGAREHKLHLVLL